MIVLCAKEYQPPSSLFPGVRRVLHAPMTDDEAPENFDVALAAAERIHKEWKRGHTILITCMMGRNRSALVAVLALFFITGIPVRDLVDHVRTVRRDPVGGVPLSNPAFVRFLSTIRYARVG